MNFKIGEKYLISTDGWFYAPDGQQYRAAFGTLRAILHDTDTLGVRTNARSTNWYVQLGDLTIAGCQIHYAIKANKCNMKPVRATTMVNGVAVSDMQPSAIYGADHE